MTEQEEAVIAAARALWRVGAPLHNHLVRLAAALDSLDSVEHTLGAGRPSRLTQRIH